MKHIKIMNLPDCDKLIYSNGFIARQIGTMFVVDDEEPLLAMTYPIVDGGKENADGWLPGGEECATTPVVCRVGEKIFPGQFAKFVKLSMHEEVPTSAHELYWQLRAHGADLKLPVMAKTQEPLREYHVELEFNDFSDAGFCYSTDLAEFYFEVYFEKGNHDDAYGQLAAQLMDYMNILDTEELGAKIIFNTYDFRYQDVVERLNKMPIDTMCCDMFEPRR